MRKKTGKFEKEAETDHSDCYDEARIGMTTALSGQPGCGAAVCNVQCAVPRLPDIMFWSGVRK